MTKIFIILLIIAGFVGKSFCQDFSLPSKHFWLLEGGVNMLIPIREYQEIHTWQGPDDVAGEFNVKPKFTATNFFVGVIYSNRLYSWKKSSVDMHINAGYQHYNRENKKQGEYGGGITGFCFNGNINIITKDDYLFLDLACTSSIRIREKLTVINQIGVSGNLLFHQHEKQNQNGFFTYNSQPAYIESEYSNDTWGFKRINLLLSYRIGVVISCNNRIRITPQVETPLFFINSLWEDNQDRDFPYSSTPYFASINNSSFINARISLEYKLRKQ